MPPPVPRLGALDRVIRCPPSRSLLPGDPVRLSRVYQATLDPAARGYGTVIEGRGDGMSVTVLWSRLPDQPTGLPRIGHFDHENLEDGFAPFAPEDGS